MRALSWERLRAACPWLAPVLLAAWTRELSPWLLVAAAVTALAALTGRRRVPTPDPRPSAVGIPRGWRFHTLGVLLALGGVVAGFAAHQQLGRLARDWQGYWAAREAEVFLELTSQIDDLVARGEEAVQELARLAEESGGRPTLGRLDGLRRSSDFAALALYDSLGSPVIWSGIHRGRVPDAVKVGLEPYAYRELPLFSYLYFTAPVGRAGGTAVVAALLRTDLPAAAGSEAGAAGSSTRSAVDVRLPDLVSRFRRSTGEEIRISTGERVGDSAVHDLRWNDRTLFSLSVARPAEAERRSDLEARWKRWVTVLALSAWLLVSFFPRARSPADGTATWKAGLAPVLSLAVLLSILPWGIVLGERDLFRSSNFLLPAPGTVTLGRLLALALAGCVLAGRPALSGRGTIPWWLSAALLALGLPLLVALVGAGAVGTDPGVLAGSERDWVIYQLTLAALLSLLAFVCLANTRIRRGDDRPYLFLPAFGAAVALALLATWQVRAVGDVPVWSAAAWALPALIALPAARAWPPWRRPLLLWLCAVVLGSSAALPFAWSQRVSARKDVADVQLSRLSAEVDPYLDFLLRRLGAGVDSLHQEGAGALELLYGPWRSSGLAEDGYPIWLTLWSSMGVPRQELGFGVGTLLRPPLPAGFLEATRAGDSVVVQHFMDADAHYMVQVPLSDGTVVSGLVPPVRRAGSFSSLGPLFGSLAGEQPEPIKLVPLIREEALRMAGNEAPRWSRTAEGWRGEVGLDFPDDAYNAQYLVDLARPPIMIARGTLLLALNLLVLLAVWAIGHAFATDERPPGRGLRGRLQSFRARVTLALFGFFILSNAIFGTLANRTIAGAAERAAEVLAERVGQDAAELYLEVQRMDLLAGRVGGDLLEYRDGELLGGATAELVELGLYEGLLPFDVYSNLGAGRELMETRVSSLGRWQYVTAFRRLADGDILAVPVPLEAGATAVRRQEVRHLLAFAVVAGAALSLGLALLVGRTLTRPIRTLQVASERVGSGNLGVRLESQRADEFGAMFSAFNRMVRRLRRARRALVRTTRRTQAIVEDAATGVIAMDAQGRVTLVNPRAESLLGRALPVGQSLSDGDGPAAEFVRWVQLYFRDGLRETSSEFQFEDRRIRVRARRIARGGGPLAGAVLSLEDVTDELRSERILAWGEMARQVAHEVKNPLTPIKLSIQHIQRARRDRRGDFDEILTRNAEAMLREIDRLATIASSFSRLAAPGEADALPLEAVRIESVVSEVLDLYESGEGPIRFGSDIPPDLPPVRAREAEMKEVLVNLLENARAAIPDRGSVTIEASAVEEGVVLSVRDDGSGIPAELLPRIFEPHFSTRSSGTGLGLAIVRRLVESWDAAVSVESPERGAIIHIWLRTWSEPAS